MQRKNLKTLAIFSGVLSFALFYIVNRFRALMLLYDAEGLISSFSNAYSRVFTEISEKPFYISFEKSAILCGLIAAAIIWLMFAYNVFSAGNYRPGEEHGSSRWGTAADIKHFIDFKNPDNNVLLTETERIMYQGRPRDMEYDRNKNVLVVGGSGSGKTRFYVKPNLMQLHSSYVITDPKGTLLPECGRMFLDAGYDVKVFNTINFSESMHYNPLKYIRNETDILKVVNVIMENTKGEGNHAAEDFWVKAERLLFSACIAYLYSACDEAERNIPNLISIINLAEAREDNEDYVSPLDELFAELEEEQPGSTAGQWYHSYKQAAGKTAKSILISCAVRLAPFNIAALKETLSSDDLDIDELGERKTALFLVVSDTDATYSFIAATLIYQMHDLLCDKAITDHNGSLPVPVRCIFDEFANIGVIPNAQRTIAVIRSRNISWDILLQSFAQLNSTYKDNADTIIDNCDTYLFLGGKGTKTTETTSKMIGKTTISNQNISETRGQSGSNTTQNQIFGRDLLDPAELSRLKRKECICIISGLFPFRSRKINLTKHKRYKLLSEGKNKDNPLKFSELTSYEAKNFLKDTTVEEVYDMSELNSLAGA